MKQHSKQAATIVAILAGASFSGGVSHAQQSQNIGLYGTPGLIDMPTAYSLPDGEFATTLSYFGNILRSTITFQGTPRVSGSFRYNGIANWNADGFETYYDRNFDVKFQVLKESEYLPAISIGLQDLGGTGLNSAEYIVASKTLGKGLQASVGLGWGRLGSNNVVSGGLSTREPIDIGTGGSFNVDQWFKGDIGLFGGLSWQATDRLNLIAEYSSDSYALESGTRQVFERKSDFNFGLRYKISRAATVGVYSMYGTEVGISLAFSLNPNNPSYAGTTETAPPAIAVRAPRAGNDDIWAENWVGTADAQIILTSSVKAELEREGMVLEGLTLAANTVTVRFENKRFSVLSQAIGRVARSLSRAMPASVETFRIIPIKNGIPLSAITIRRTDLEALEHNPDATETLLAVTGFSDAPLNAPQLRPEGVYPRLTWALAPYIRTSYFEPENPLRFEIGGKAEATYHFAPGWSIGGRINQPFGGTLDGSDRESNSVLPRVRTEGYLYNQATGPVLVHLTLDHYRRLGQDLYFHGSAGYLERMFAGVAAEVLWKPVSSRLGLGFELAHVQQRDFDGGFGLRDYSVTTGHASAYYELGNDYLIQVDAGRYLAGDTGATLTMTREFANGWRVGAFATKTNVSAEDFGEGSFDKGFIIQAPFTYFLGNQTTQVGSTTIRPIQRDGGARLNVRGRLYQDVRNAHKQRLSHQWGRVWK
ncbi:YjbH domain-containing protein [Algirhabdus cladophorae]|uniref:YjbH domain-containing protein n=1 Tax=Algirhabdus cladophorae TaxID=3377108 RepID=UPI003B8468EE